MTPDLVAAFVGLALLDSLNTSTLFLVMVVLLTARRPTGSAVAYAVGATLSFLGLAIGLYGGAAAAEAVISDLARWLRRATFTLLALWLLYLGVKRLGDRARRRSCCRSGSVRSPRSRSASWPRWRTCRTRFRCSSPSSG